MSFHEATQVTATGNGRYTATIAEGWDIAQNANGGYLLATVARAITDALGKPDPLTTTGHYLKPGRPGPVTIDVAVLRNGKRHGTASATLFSDGEPLLAVLGTATDLSLADGPEQVDDAVPEIPDPDDCFRIEPTDTFPPPFMGRVELRIHPDDAGFAQGTKSGKARMRGWFRLRDDEPIDTLALVLATDAFPRPSSTPTCPSRGRRRWSSPPTCGHAPPPGGSAASLPPASSPAATSKPTARSGTPTAT
jgi:hypothetical protein